jgi:hypothetical protein
MDKIKAEPLHTGWGELKCGAPLIGAILFYNSGRPEQQIIDCCSIFGTTFCPALVC